MSADEAKGDRGKIPGGKGEGGCDLHTQVTFPFPWEREREGGTRGRASGCQPVAGTR